MSLRAFPLNGATFLGYEYSMKIFQQMNFWNVENWSFIEFMKSAAMDTLLNKTYSRVEIEMSWNIDRLNRIIAFVVPFICCCLMTVVIWQKKFAFSRIWINKFL